MNFYRMTIDGIGVYETRDLIELLDEDEDIDTDEVYYDFWETLDNLQFMMHSTYDLKPQFRAHSYFTKKALDERLPYINTVRRFFEDLGSTVEILVVPQGRYELVDGDEDQVLLIDNIIL